MHRENGVFFGIEKHVEVLAWIPVENQEAGFRTQRELPEEKTSARIDAQVVRLELVRGIDVTVVVGSAGLQLGQDGGALIGVQGVQGPLGALGICGGPAHPRAQALGEDLHHVLPAEPGPAHR